MYVQRPESGLVTALAVISLVLGTIGLLGSFIPCLGSLAMIVGIPGALCGAGAVFMAKSKRVSIGLPVAALSVSLLGVVISAVQMMALNAAAKSIKDGAVQMDETMRRQREQQQQQQQNTNPSPNVN